jgi:hypothetical protein
VQRLGLGDGADDPRWYWYLVGDSRNPDPAHCETLRKVIPEPLKCVAHLSRKLGLDLVPRQGAQMVDPDSMSVVELYHFHVSSAENSQGLSVGCSKNRTPVKF